MLTLYEPPTTKEWSNTILENGSIKECLQSTTNDYPNQKLVTTPKKNGDIKSGISDAANEGTSGVLGDGFIGIESPIVTSNFLLTHEALAQTITTQ